MREVCLIAESVKEMGAQPCGASLCWHAQELRMESGLVGSAKRVPSSEHQTRIGGSKPGWTWLQPALAQVCTGTVKHQLR